MPQPLDVLADLRLAVDGEEIDIQAEGDRIVVDLPSLQAGRRLFEAEPLARSRARTMRRTTDVLDTMGLVVELRLNGTPFARLGAGTKPGRLGRLLGVPGAELELAGSVRAAARQRPIVTALVLGGVALLIGSLLIRALRS